MNTAWRWFKRIAPWALAAAVLALVAQQARTMDWAAVQLALRGQSPWRLAAAGTLALLSLGLYASFDLIGRRLTGHSVSTARTLLTAAISYAFNLNFGSWIGGIGLRLRLYTRWGLDTATVTKLIANGMLCNWLGYLAVAGTLLTLAPPPQIGSWNPPDATLQVLGALMAATAPAYLALCRCSKRREWTVRGHVLVLPEARTALLQLLAGSANWLLIGSVVWVVLGQRIDYPSVLGTLLLAAVAGVVTHVPAGLGVIEAVFISTLGHRLPAAELLAGLLAYRATYYLLPLALALPAYGLIEAGARQQRALQPT